MFVKSLSLNLNSCLLVLIKGLLYIISKSTIKSFSKGSIDIYFSPSLTSTLFKTFINFLGSLCF